MTGSTLNEITSLCCTIGIRENTVIFDVDFEADSKHPAGRQKNL